MKTHGKAVLGCVLAACLTSIAVAKPVNYEKDLLGKKVCWTTPSAPSTAQVTETTYSPGRKFYSTYWGNGACQGSHCVTDKGNFESHVEKMPDGTFKSTTGINGAVYESTGHYCP